MKTFDLVVIGAGPGGYTAAIRGAQLGGKICLVEKGELGGTCTNRGCIPTKALSASAHALAKAREAQQLGVVISGEVRLDFVKVVKRRDEVVATLRDGIAKLLKANKVERISGAARLVSPHRVVVEGPAAEELATKSVIVASGSIPASLAVVPTNGAQVVTSDDLLLQRELPRRMVVIGGGVIGSEFASIYRTFGVEVTVVELLERLVPTLDPALSTLLQRAFKKDGVRVLTRTAVESASCSETGVRLDVREGEPIVADLVLVAVGRQAATAGIGLEGAGVKLVDHGRIQVDEHMRTGVEGLYAIGDAVGKTWLAHTAAREGEVAAANSLGHSETMHYRAIPSVVFSSPELASVGLTAAEAEAKGIEIEVGGFFYGASGKALCDGLGDGRVEIVVERGSGRVLGGFVAGEHAGSLISEITLAVDRGLTARELAEVVHAHPTLPEMIQEAAAETFGRAIHKAPARSRR